MKARKVRRDLEDELAKFELKKKGGDIPFNEALEMYLTYLEGRVKNGLISASTYENRKNDLRKYSKPINETNITEINRSKIEALGRVQRRLKNEFGSDKEKYLEVPSSSF